MCLFSVASGSDEPVLRHWEETTHGLWIVNEWVRFIVSISDINQILHPVSFFLLGGPALKTRANTTTELLPDVLSAHTLFHSVGPVDRCVGQRSSLCCVEAFRCSVENTYIFALKLLGQLFHLSSFLLIIGEGVVRIQRRSQAFRDQRRRGFDLQYTEKGGWWIKCKYRLKKKHN